MSTDLAPDRGLEELGAEEAVRLAHASIYVPGVLPVTGVLPMSYGARKDWRHHPRWDDVEAQVAFALAHDAEPVYRVATIMRPDLAPGSRGGSAEVLAACALWADIDDSRGVHQVQELPDPSPEQAWEVLRSYPLAPTGVVDTGGGLLAWWATDAFDPRSNEGRKLLEGHGDALGVLHQRLGVAYDGSIPRSTSPSVRVPVGVNGKSLDEAKGKMPPERAALVREDITTAPVKLVFLEPGNRYRWEEVLGALGEAGLLVPRLRRPASSHVCGGERPEERICATLPMSRVCREMTFIAPDGEHITWSPGILDGQEQPLVWSHEHKSHAKLYFDPPSGHDDMPPVSTITCWGENTAKVFGAVANQGRTCTWRWLANGYFGSYRYALAFARAYADKPDEAMELLAAHPDHKDLLHDLPSLAVPQVVRGGRKDDAADRGRANGTWRPRPTKLPWEREHPHGGEEVRAWLSEHASSDYGLALQGPHLIVANEEGDSTTVHLKGEAVAALEEATVGGGRPKGRWWAHDASALARYVALRTGRRLDVLGTRAIVRALAPGEDDGLDKDEPEAVQVARLGRYLAEAGGPQAMNAARHDKLWRHLAVDGIGVDMELLRSEAGGHKTTAGKAQELLRAAEGDGRVRPIVDVYGAVTGRMAVSDPAVQNIPPALRPCLLADGGKRLVGLDLAQVEPRVAAGMSGDAEMMAAVSSGDVYAAAASVVWPGSAVTPERRALAKRVLLARLYGQGYAALARAIDLSPEDAQDITNRLLRGWPVLRSWMAGLTARAKAGEKLVTLAGRELPAPPADESYKAVNWVVQGSAADLFYRFTERVAKKLPASARLWLPLHDELIVECETGDEASVADLLSQVMRCRVGGVEIFGQPTAYGSRWGQKDGAKQQPAAA